MNFLLCSVGLILGALSIPIVFGDKKEKIGIVNDVISLPANDIIIVKKDEKEHLIPLIDDVVLDIDQNQEVIIIDPIEVLFI